MNLFLFNGVGFVELLLLGLFVLIPFYYGIKLIKSIIDFLNRH